jgi:hypothetical protein
VSPAPSPVRAIVEHIDARAVAGGINQYLGAAVLADMLEVAWRPDDWRAAAGGEMPSPNVIEQVKAEYLTRAREPHVTGITRMSRCRLAEFAGELRQLVETAGEDERKEAWFEWAERTERQVRAELAVRVAGAS